MLSRQWNSNEKGKNYQAIRRKWGDQRLSSKDSIMESLGCLVSLMSKLIKLPNSSIICVPIDCQSPALMLLIPNGHAILIFFFSIWNPQWSCKANSQEKHKEPADLLIK